MSRTGAFAEIVITGALMTSPTGRSRALLKRPAGEDCLASISSHHSRLSSPRRPMRSPSLTMPTGRSPASSTGTPPTPDSSMSRATEDTGSVARAAIAGELMRSPASRYEALSERWRGPIVALFETTEKRAKPGPTGLPDAIPAELLPTLSLTAEAGRSLERSVRAASVIWIFLTRLFQGRNRSGGSRKLRPISHLEFTSSIGREVLNVRTLGR